MDFEVAKDNFQNRPASLIQCHLLSGPAWLRAEPTFLQQFHGLKNILLGLSL